MTLSISFADKALLCVLLGRPVARSNQSFYPGSLKRFDSWMFERRIDNSYVRAMKVMRAIRIQSLSIVRSGQRKVGEIPGMSAQLDLAHAFNLSSDSRAQGVSKPPGRT